MATSDRGADKHLLSGTCKQPTLFTTYYDSHVRSEVRIHAWSPYQQLTKTIHAKTRLEVTGLQKDTPIILHHSSKLKSSPRVKVQSWLLIAVYSSLKKIIINVHVPIASQRLTIYIAGTTGSECLN